MCSLERTATNARSRRTREALLRSARGLVEAEGLNGLTMAAVAHRAGVTRRAAYLHFASRGDLVAALFDYVARVEGLEQSLEPVWQAADAEAALDAWAAHLARYHPRLVAVDRAVTQAAPRDPDAAAHRVRVSANQRTTCTRLAKALADEGRLAAAWTVETASDMLFALISTDMVARLVGECGWTQAQLADGLKRLFRSTFVAR
jgi:AcrR family transcriptional regulator